MALELPAEAVAVHPVLFFQSCQRKAFIVMGLQPGFDVLQIGGGSLRGEGMRQGQPGEQRGQQHMAEDGAFLLFPEQGEEVSGPGRGGRDPPEGHALGELAAEIVQARAVEEQQRILRPAAHQHPAGRAAVHKVEAALRKGRGNAGGKEGEVQGAGLQAQEPQGTAPGGIVGDGAGYGAPFQGDAVEEGVPDLRFRVEGCQVHP